MPAIIRPKPETVGVNADPVVGSSAELLKRTSKAWTIAASDAQWADTNKKVGPEDRPVLRTSFTDLDSVPTSASGGGLIPYGNGFVDGIMRAFQQDLHLVLRPDDVWLAILVQFNFYVNGHAEELRKTFVRHEGKEILAIDVTPATLADVDIGRFAQGMTDLMQEFIIEQDVREWLIPAFSTTTDEDRSVAAIVMMATMKAYFEYVMLFGCGFPSVTLEGEKSDWEDIRERVRKFGRYGDEPAEWAVYLEKTLDYMVRSFERPDDQDIKDFWMRVCHEAGSEGSGMGMHSLSGWITAFCFWDEAGKKIFSYSDEELAKIRNHGIVDRKRLVLDGVQFPVIRRKGIPKAVAEAPVLVMDLSGIELETTLIAGCIGMHASAAQGSKSSAINTVRPRSGWWMLLDKAGPLS
ncbi:hypothetical protein GQ53DRAFT_635993 [Thozetella sp. PMI_491]|nr:hypothetical protein GQ53DRAFT_635993 [Thozetella sp. PMI_491]